MNSNNHIEKLLSNINSLSETISDLQGQVDNLHNTHQEYTNNISENMSNPSEEVESHINNIKNTVISRSNHLQDIINNSLHPSVIQQRIDNINKLEERKQFWANWIEQNKVVNINDN